MRMKLFNERDKFLFESLYVDERLSMREIGRQLGCSEATIRNYFKEFKIPSRSISESHKEIKHTEESKRKMSFYAKNRPVEHNKRISDALKGKEKSEEAKRKMSEHGKTRIGEKSSNWNNGSSFLPYCFKFNEAKKEEIRNQYSRVCIVSGISALQNGQRLSVDHADENKMQGCNGISFKLAPLSKSVHSKMSSQQNHLLLELLLYGNRKAEMNYEF